MGACQQGARGLAAEHPLHGIRRPGGSHVTFVHARPGLGDPRERPARPMSPPQGGSPNCQNAASQRMSETGVSTCLARIPPSWKAVSAKHDWRFGGNPVVTLVQASRSRSKPRSSNAPACCSVGPGADRNRLPGRPGREAWFNVSEARPASGGIKLRTGSPPVARLVPALAFALSEMLAGPTDGPRCPRGAGPAVVLEQDRRHAGRSASPQSLTGRAGPVRSRGIVAETAEPGAGCNAGPQGKVQPRQQHGDVFRDFMLSAMQEDRRPRPLLRWEGLAWPKVRSLK